VEVTVNKIPLGGWPKDPKMKELGRWFRLLFLEMTGMDAYTLALFTRNGWSEEETKVLLAKSRAELKSGRMHTYTKQ
jgi:hypothetical protein